MTDETVECYNCGRTNPEWAQVCRSCGVALRHGEARVVPTSRFPTDQQSLMSMGAVVGTILVAVILGLIVSNLNPTDPTIGASTPSPTPSLAPSVAPSVAPSEAPTPPPTPSPTPLPGTLAFGTGLDGNRAVTGATDTFTPSTNFAYSLNVPGGIGGTPIRNVIERTSDPAEMVVEGDEIQVDPESETVGYALGSAAGFVADWGPGEYVWQIYVGDKLVAEATFRLAEG